MSFDAFITACTIDEFRQHSTTYPDDFDDEDCCLAEDQRSSLTGRIKVYD